MNTYEQNFHDFWGTFKKPGLRLSGVEERGVIKSKF